MGKQLAVLDCGEIFVDEHPARIVGHDGLPASSMGAATRRAERAGAHVLVDAEALVAARGASAA